MPILHVPIDVDIPEDLKWGHALKLLDLQGSVLREIRVPFVVFADLRKLGLLIRRKHAIYADAAILMFKDRRLDTFVMQLRDCLGYDLSGPTWCLCTCKACKKRFSSKEAQELLRQQSEALDKQVCGSTSSTDLVNEIKRRRKYK